MNQVTLIGRVGKDPELRYFESGKPKVSFSLATTRTWKDPNGTKKEKTEWHTVEFWGKVAEVIAEHVQKGNQFAVSGEINYKEWTNDDGVKKYATVIKGETFEFIGSKNSGRSDANSSTGAQVQGQPVAQATGGNDDLPF